MVSKIPLTGTKGAGKFALVDSEDFPYLSKFNWNYDKDGYAVRTINCYREDGVRTTKGFKMHREVLGISDSKIKIDHIDHDKLNNCKENLRICSSKQNCWNRGLTTKKTSSKYKGVVFRKGRNKWSSRIVFNYKLIHLGDYNTEEEAALAYNEKAKELFGEFAYLNKVEVT